MRVVGGRLRGRGLIGPKSDAIRPTSDRLRENLFNVLAHSHDNACQEARVLDLFAGTGAMAIEALSRGAVFAAMVDESAEARGLMRTNVDAMGLGGVTRILRRDATKLGAVSPFEPFTLIFCDPPYRRGLGERALVSARDGGWLAPGALVLLEDAAEQEVSFPEGVALIDTREAGAGKVLIGRFV